MNKVVIGFVVGAVAVGAVGYGTLVYPEQRARAQVDKAIAELSPDTQVSYRSLGYSLFTGTLTLGGVEMTVREGDETLHARLESVVLRDLSKDRVGQMRGTGFSLRDPEDTARVEADTLDGDNLTAQDGVLQGIAGSTASPNVNIGRLALNGVRITAGDDVTRLREIVVTDYVQNNKVPQAMALSVRGLEVEGKSLPDADARQMLEGMGYDRLALNFELAYAHLPATEQFHIKRLSVGGDGVGHLNMSATFGHMPLPTSDNPEEVLAALQNATLEKLELRYDDASLANRVMKMAATESEMSEGDFKSNILEQLAREGGQAETELGQQLIVSLGAFLNDPKSLTLQMNPPQPVPLVLLAMASESPQSMVKLTGMAVFANR